MVKYIVAKRSGQLGIINGNMINFIDMTSGKHDFYSQSKS